MKPQIIQAADAVAYLPLYLAEDNKPTLLLESGNELRWNDAFGEIHRSPPCKFLEGLQSGPETTGDRACYNAIQAAWAQRIPLIGICDPCDVKYFDDIVLVAGFINKASFWCLTDDEMADVQRPEELVASDLFVHERGFETGFFIGEHVREEIRKFRRRLPQLIQGDFDLLVDGAVWKKRNFPDSSVAAISASILSCVLAMDKGFKIQFALGDFPPYREFLTTGIIVHKEALSQVEPSLVLLVRALNRACEEISAYSRPAEFIERLCNQHGRFEKERRIDCAEVDGGFVRRLKATPSGTVAPITAAQARQVSSYLDGIYSQDCEISEAAWQNAWLIREKGGAAPPLAKYFCRDILERVKKCDLKRAPQRAAIPITAVVAVKTDPEIGDSGSIPSLPSDKSDVQSRTSAFQQPVEFTAVGGRDGSKTPVIVPRHASKQRIGWRRVKAFLYFVGPKSLAAAAVLVGLILAAAQVWPGVKAWAEACFTALTKVPQTPLFWVLLVIVVIIAGGIVYALWFSGDEE